MIKIYKKRKCTIVFDNILNNIAETKNIDMFLEFDEKELSLILKCNYMEYNVINRIIKNIPPNIIKIVFGGWFNLDIQKYLHSGIILIKFGFEFNQLVNCLPIQLKYLTFGYKFNQLVNNLPNGLIKIFFASFFNQSIDMLPDSIEEIYLCGKI